MDVRLVSDMLIRSTLECPEEDQIKVVDSCLLLVHADRDDRTRQVGYALLSRIIERCSAPCLRLAQSRLAKRLADVANAPTLQSGLFLRQMLVRNPQVGELHSGTIDRIIMGLIDQALVQESDHLRSLSVELFAVRYGCSNLVKLSHTIEQLLILKTTALNDDNNCLALKTFAMSQLRNELLKCLYDILGACFKHAKQGELVDRGRLLSVLELGLRNSTTHDASLGAISQFCTHAGLAALPLVPRLVSLLVSLLSASPSAALFDCLSTIGRLFGAGSSLYKHFYIIFSSLSHPLTKQPYGEAAASLLATTIRVSAFLIKPEVLLSVQKTICDQAVRDPTSRAYRTVLEALLTNTHELVPVPIQIARTVVERSPQCSSSDGIATLCDVLSRPRIQNLAFSDLQRRAPSQMNNFKVEIDDDGIPTTEQGGATGGIVRSDKFDEKVEEVLREINQEEDEEQKDPDEEGVELVEAKVEPMEQSEPVVAVKRSAAQANLPTPTTKKNMKKKKTAAQAATILAEGEASVDDILSSFCPS